MEIFNLIRGHLALLTDKPLTTPTQEKPFSIKGLGTQEGDWQIVISVSTGNTDKVYISDLLRVYTFIVTNYPKSLPQAEIDKFIKENCVTHCTSYVIPMLGTFSDIKIEKEPKLTICFIPPRE